MALRLVTGPATYPVSLQEVKDHLRIDHSDLDDHLELLIAGETRYAEDFMGRKLVPQTWDYLIDAFPASNEPQVLRLPIPKVISVDAVYYLDTTGAEQTWDAAEYVADIDSEPARIGLAEGGTWPTTYTGLNSVRIRMTVGNQDDSVSPPTPDVLEDIKVAILLRVQASYDGGDMAGKIRDASEIYLKRRRVHVSLG